MYDESLIPAEHEIYGWIERVFSQGVRRPGYPADVWTEDFVVERFNELGLQNVRREPVELLRWEPRSATLTVTPAGGEPIAIACFPAPLAAPTPELRARLVAFDHDAPGSAAGAASLYDVTLLKTPYGFFSHIATSEYDPDASFAGAAHLVPFGREIQDVMEPSIEAGAVAFVGVLAGYPGDSREYYVPYDAKQRPIPGVWISGSDGARLHEMLSRGDVDVTLRADTVQPQVTTYNIIGELPGADDETVIIGSHHDGPWASAVEDASGVALVLAQATYWSRVPQQQRPHRLVFLMNSGHMFAGAGAKAYCEQHAGELERCVLEVHLEHAAEEFDELDGELRSTGQPVARWWFTSRIPALEATVQSAIEAEDMRRSFVLPPTALGPRPTTDGSEFFLYNVPIVNFLAAPFYLFDSMDTLDKIHRPTLVPLTRATIRIIDSTAGVTAAQMRAGATL
jgi:hypothetical protein